MVLQIVNQYEIYKRITLNIMVTLFQKRNRFRLKREVSFVKSFRIVVMTSALILRLLRTVIIITIIIEVALLK